MLELRWPRSVLIRWLECGDAHGGARALVDLWSYPVREADVAVGTVWQAVAKYRRDGFSPGGLSLPRRATEGWTLAHPSGQIEHEPLRSGGVLMCTSSSGNFPLRQGSDQVDLATRHCFSTFSVRFAAVLANNDGVTPGSMN